MEKESATDEQLQCLLATRDVLQISIRESKSITLEIEDVGSRMKETSRNLETLQASVRSMTHVNKIRAGVDGAVCCGAAVAHVLGLVYKLRSMLEIEPPGSSLLGYVTNIRSLDEVLKLLADNCRLVTVWLEDVLRLVKKSTGNDPLLIPVAQVMKILIEQQWKRVSFRQDAGALAHAFDCLEGEYERLLMNTSFLDQNRELLKDELILEQSRLQEFKAVTDILAAEGRLNRCISIFTQARITTVRSIIEALDIKYAEIKLSPITSIESVGEYVEQWSRNMEFVVKYLLQKEHKLCRELYLKFEAEKWMKCFAKIASSSGFLDILGFGCTICICKKEALKLLTLLKVFSTLDKLRLDFNELFIGNFCVAIRNQTRALIKDVVKGISEIFFELVMQVELQRDYSIQLDGGVQWLVLFLPEYINHLLEDENQSVLIRALEILGNVDLKRQWSTMQIIT